ncbi:Uncharacterised protein [Mycobacteroides abscessus subsp. abscessus]|nr:Uncharacterised protein [Mycobacteroides abscessus subsp. abscessus]
MGIMIVEASMKAVDTQSIWSTPSSSPTIVGSAVASTVWLRENMNIAIISPTKRRMIAEVVIGCVSLLWLPGEVVMSPVLRSLLLLISAFISVARAP